MCRNLLRFSTGLLLLFGLVSTRSTALAQQSVLTIESEQGSREIRGVPYRENSYFSVPEICSILGLTFREVEGALQIEGSDGTLRLIADRALVESRQHSVLLTGPIWRNEAGHWFAPEDFLVRSLPAILGGRLEQLETGRYRFRQPVRIRVQLAPIRDGLRVALRGVDALPRVRVRDRSAYLDLELEGEWSLQLPDLPETPILSALEVDFQPRRTVLRILKGRGFYDFRQLPSTSPQIRTIDLLAPPSTFVNLPPPETGPEAVEVPEADSADELATETVRRRRADLVLDPGHGGTDAGTQVAGVSEKDLTLALALQIQALCESKELDCALTRNRDVNLSIQHRSAVGNYYQPRLFLSLHVGGAPEASTRGPVVYVFPLRPDEELNTEPLSEQLVLWDQGQEAFADGSSQLAQILMEELNSIFGTDNRVVKAPLAVLAPLRAPAVLVEIGTLTSPEDQSDLISAEFQERLTQTLARGINRFLTRNAEPETRNQD